MVIRSYTFGLVAAAMVLARGAREELVRIVDAVAYAFARFCIAALALIRPEPSMIAGGGFAEFSGSWGSPLDSSLQHSLRHEARTRTRGAPRHI